MKKFIDREDELATLENEYRREGSALVILYGRRRVGKTTLISEFIKDKNALFFLASEESETQNQLAFKERAAEFIHSELLANADVKNWELLFKAIMETHFEKKPIIVIDEFQYIGKSNPAFPSVFQRIWEEVLKDKDLMVILWLADLHDGITDTGIRQPVVRQTDCANSPDTDSFSLLSSVFS